MNATGASSHPAGASVLICDDADAVRRLLKVILSEAGHRPVGEATDGHEAVTEAERLQPDVILLDLAMPRLSGLDAIPDLRRVAPRSHIIVLSGFAATQVAKQVVELGAVCYIEKGACARTLISAIEQAVADAPAPIREPVAS